MNNFEKITRSQEKYSFDEWKDKKKSDKRGKPKRDRKGKRENY